MAVGIVADLKLELVPGLGDNKTDLAVVMAFSSFTSIFSTILSGLIWFLDKVDLLCEDITGTQEGCSFGDRADDVDLKTKTITLSGGWLCERNLKVSWI